MLRRDGTTIGYPRVDGPTLVGEPHETNWVPRGVACDEVWNIFFHTRTDAHVVMDDENILSA